MIRTYDRVRGWMQEAKFYLLLRRIARYYSSGDDELATFTSTNLHSLLDAISPLLIGVESLAHDTRRCSPDKMRIQSQKILHESEDGEIRTKQPR